MPALLPAPANNETVPYAAYTDTMPYVYYIIFQRAVNMPYKSYVSYYNSLKRPTRDDAGEKGKLIERKN